MCNLYKCYLLTYLLRDDNEVDDNVDDDDDDGVAGRRRRVFFAPQHAAGSDVRGQRTERNGQSKTPKTAWPSSTIRRAAAPPSQFHATRQTSGAKMLCRLQLLRYPDSMSINTSTTPPSTLIKMKRHRISYLYLPF